jgi:two-component system NarL family response regulator
MTIRIMLADDHRMFRDALCAMLQRVPDIEVVAQADDGKAVLANARRSAPHVVVMDIRMPELDGVKATRQLLAELPSVRVIALSAFADRGFVLEMLGAGATGYVIKAAAGDELIQAIRVVAAGQTYLSPQIAGTLVQAVRGHGDPAAIPPAKLGKRETEVLRLIAEGRTSPEIAELLHIAPGTVEVHRRNIMQKLDLHNVAELTRWAIRNGLTSV